MATPVIERKQRVGRGLTWVLLASLALGPAACRKAAPGPLPTLDLPADRYEQVVSAYFGGVAALQVGDTTGRAKELLVRARELAPEEPAILADLALYHLRNQGAPAATELVTEARKLAPADSRLALLEALVADRRGEPEAAVKVLEEAIALDGGNLRARYALKEALQRAAAADADQAAAVQLDAILKERPQNLTALLDRARLAAKVGDAAALGQALAGLSGLAAGWPEEVRTQLTEVEAAKGGDPKALAPRLAVLQNLLLPTAAYQTSVRELRLPDDTIGEPIGAFLRLPQPSPQADAPDATLSFAASTLEGIAADAVVVSLGALPLGEEGAPRLVADLGGRALVLGGADPVELSLPGVVAAEGAEGDAVAVSLLALDWNNDKRMDLAACGPGGIALFKADAAGYADVTGDSGVAAINPAPCSGAWTLDLELDGDLDLVLGRGAEAAQLLRNNGDGSWLPLAAADLGDLGGLTDLRQLVWADLDSDGDADLAVANGDKLRLLDNRRSGSYAALDLAGGEAADLRALLAIDENGDGWLDLATLAADGSVAIRRADPAASVAGAPAFGPAEELRPARGPGASCQGLSWGDVDNNGAADLLVGCDQPQPTTRISLSDGQGGWQDLPPLTSAARSLADLDGDGKLDLVAKGPEGYGRLMNQGGEADYHYQVLLPRGLEIPAAPPEQSGVVQSGDQRINSFGQGGLVSIRAGLLTQTRLIDEPALHFGLGKRQGVETAHIHWPNGLPQGEFDLAADKAVTATQRLKGSCPWLFADNGTAIAFVTDILWKSPLGLRINAVDTAGVVQTEDWVKVRGDQLAARDGFYDLRITAELWETHFFDQVGLMVVDHPEGSEVFVDERFSIPPPPLAVQATGPLQPVDKALDQDGQDVSERVAARDETYLDSFDRGAYQGIAEDHWVELELGEAAAAILAQPATASVAGGATQAPTLALYATGFIYPTDSSINVAIGQGKAAAPQDLSIEVPDGQGGWKAAKTRLGFPAGKQKSLLIPLADLDPAGAPAPQRLRLRTNLEVYWDQLALTTLHASPSEDRLRSQRLAPHSAELRYRGLSVTSHTGADPAPHSQPEIPRYDQVVATVPWLNLEGFYTRFGDVKPLLDEVDDRYVILNAGDEILLRFAAPADPPAGWVRDFVFISDGWEKDGDFNTAYGETVLPLPAHDKPEYADPRRFGPVGRLQDDPVYQAHSQDWVDYHTRYVPPQRLRRVLQPVGR